MSYITLGGEDYELKLNHDAIEKLEEYYNQSIVHVMNNMDIKLSDMKTFILSMNTNGLSKRQLDNHFRELVDSGEFDYQEVLKPITEAVAESKAFQKMGKRKESLQKAKQSV